MRLQMDLNSHIEGARRKKIVNSGCDKGKLSKVWYLKYWIVTLNKTSHKCTTRSIAKARWKKLAGARCKKDFNINPNISSISNLVCIFLIVGQQGPGILEDNTSTWVCLYVCVSMYVGVFVLHPLLFLMG